MNRLFHRHQAANANANANPVAGRGQVVVYLSELGRSVQPGSGRAGRSEGRT